MDILQQTRKNSADLADELASVMAMARARVPGEGMRVHLWRFEHAAARNDWIDARYRVALARALVAAWRADLTRVQGGAWRLLFYQDVMPTIALHPADDTRSPLPGPQQRVACPGEVLLRYQDAPWPSDDTLPDAVPHAPEILRVVADNAGSLGRHSAAALGLKPAACVSSSNKMGWPKRST